MAGIFRLSEAVLLGLHAMAYLARKSGDRVTVREVADVYSASAHHLAKVLRQLSRRKLVKVVRGPSGGFSLAKPPSKITLMQIYQAIDGEYDSTVCFANAKKCPMGGCLLGGQIEKITLQLKEYLTKTTLAMAVKRSAEETGGGGNPCSGSL